MKPYSNSYYSQVIVVASSCMVAQKILALLKVKILAVQHLRRGVGFKKIGHFADVLYGRP